MSDIDTAYRAAAAEPYLPEHRPHVQQRVDGVIVDPLLRRSFEATDNNKRPPLETHDWWGLPFIRTQSGTNPDWLEHWPSGTRYDVRCLDGGAWDRSSWLGAFATLSEAIQYVQEFKYSSEGLPK